MGSGLATLENPLQADPGLQRAKAIHVYVIDGRLSVDGESLSTGDAAKITGETELGFSTDLGAELILIDVPLEFESVGVWAAD
jgi:redox-sensitive bicupin YhaK (pirin superfamily)